MEQSHDKPKVVVELDELGVFWISSNADVEVYIVDHSRGIMWQPRVKNACHEFLHNIVKIAQELTRELHLTNEEVRRKFFRPKRDH